MHLLYLKVFHIAFVVTWFAGLFYIVRLYIYHTEASTKAEPERSILINHFKTAERRLLFGITLPSMILTYIFGFWMAFAMFGTDFPKWLWIKLSLVFLLSLYHLQCHIMYKNLKQDKYKYSSMQLRMWNEVTTLFLFAIIYFVVVRDENWQKVLGWIAGVALLLYAAIQLYKKIRESAGQKPQ
jgi:protoporphyrinogen IX oxidase